MAGRGWHLGSHRVTSPPRPSPGARRGPHVRGSGGNRADKGARKEDEEGGGRERSSVPLPCTHGAGGRAAPSRRWEGAAAAAGAARRAREGTRRALPARVAPQLPVAQRRRVNLPVSVGQGLPGEQQLVAASAAQRRRRQGAWQGSQPTG